MLLTNQAIDLAIASILSAFSVLVLSVAGYIQLRGQNIKQEEKLQAVKEQVQQGGGATSTVLAVAPQPPASPRAPLPAPAWNQLNDPLPDGQQDPYATTDCGEESTAMAIAACGGPNLPAGVLRQLLGGANRSGTTDAQALCYLLSLFKIKSHVRECPADVAWTEWRHSFEAGFLVIALGWWVTDGYPHWVLIRQADDSAMTYNDPWGGLEKRMGKQWAQLKYQGTYVHVDQAVSAPAPPPP